jgi:hypothetical protein
MDVVYKQLSTILCKGEIFKSKTQNRKINEWNEKLREHYGVNILECGLNEKKPYETSLTYLSCQLSYKINHGKLLLS